MTNENNKVQELVFDDDDDPTSELEVLKLENVPSSIISETDEPTYDPDAEALDEHPIAASKPQSGEAVRTETIGRLQFDIEQLHSKWLGLEAEIKAREELTANLTQELNDTRQKLAKKAELVGIRDELIQSLQTEVRHRNDEYASLRASHAELEQQATENAILIDELRTNHAEAETRIADLEQELEQLRSAEQSARDSGARVQDELAKEQSALSEARGTISRLETDVAALQSDRDAQSAEIERLAAQADELREDLRRAGHDVETRDSAIQELRRERDEIQRQFDAVDQVEIEENRRLLSEQAGQLAGNKVVIADLRAAVTRSETYADTLRQQLQDHLQDTATVEEEQGKLQVALDQATAELEGLHTALSEERQARSTLQAEFDSARELHAAQEARLRDELQNSTETAEERRQQNEQTRGELADVRAELAEERQARKSLSEELAEKAKLHAEALAAVRGELDAAEATAGERGKLNEEHQTQLDELQWSLAEERQTRNKLEKELAEQKDSYAQELRTLREGLKEAEDTVSQQEEVNEQLITDLIEMRGIREDLEHSLADSEERSKTTIDDLEKEIRKLKRQANEYEHKLESKSEAVNELLAELAKKTQQLESIGRIEDVIHDIEHRMLDRIEDHPVEDQGRVTRVLVGSVDGRELRFPLFKNRLTIGRTGESDIQVKAPYISRRHAIVVTEGETARIVDWGSKNGVFVNSARISEHSLKDGDIVTIGTAKLRYEELPRQDAGL